MENENLKNIFKPLQNATREPHPLVWNRLDARLKSEKKQKFQTLFNFSVAAALIVLFTIVATLMIDTRKPSQDTANHSYQHPLSDSTHTIDSLKPKN